MTPCAQESRPSFESKVSDINPEERMLKTFASIHIVSNAEIRPSSDTTSAADWEELSEELLLEIMKHLEPIDLARVSRVSKQWQRLSNDPHLWREHCRNDSLRVNTSKQNPPSRFDSWRSVWTWFYRARNREFSPSEVKTGLGSFEWANGAKYEGEWKDDKEHGWGFKKWKDGATYEGQWQNGQFEGYGEHSWASGSLYKGQWSNHKRNGWGVNVWPHKDRYEGQWKNDQKDGFGIYEWTDGRSYRGQWKENKRSGKGTFLWPASGYGYDGDWLDDKRHGKGKFAWADGDYFEGNWVDGKREGYGIFHCRNGCVLEQFWHEDEFDAGNKGTHGVQRCFDDNSCSPTLKRKTGCCVPPKDGLQGDMKRRKLLECDH